MQEVLLDHQASHITLQTQNFSSLPPRSSASIGSAPSRPGRPFLANISDGQLPSAQCSSSTVETHTFSGTQVAHPSSSDPEYPSPALRTICTVPVTILHRAVWSLLAKQSMTHTSSCMLCPKQVLRTAHMQLKEKTVEALTLKNKWQMEMFLSN